MPILSYTDQDVLGNDPAFRSRIRQALVAQAIVVMGEALTVAQHTARGVLANRILLGDAPGNFHELFARVIATIAAVGTQAGSPPVQANVTDATIDAVIQGAWTAFAVRGSGAP